MAARRVRGEAEARTAMVLARAARVNFIFVDDGVVGLLCSVI
jgi:hypothetical protein